MSFKLKGADGKPITIQDGDFYLNTKARARRMMLNSLSSDARRVYACLELATMGFQQELAVTMDAGKIRHLTPSDVCQQTQLTKQNVRRAFEELEDQGLAKRETDDGGDLRRGHIRLYSWAEPHPTRPKIKEVVARDYFPSWFPDSWEPLRPLISRYKYSLIDDEVVARDYFEEGAEVARDYQYAEIVAARFLERVRAQRKREPASLYVEKKEITAAAETVAKPQKTQSAAAGPSEADQILEVLRKYGRTDLDTARRLINRCRENFKAATTEEILLMIGETTVPRGTQRPIGFLVDVVPKGFENYTRNAPADDPQQEKRAREIAYLRQHWKDIPPDEQRGYLDEFPELQEEGNDAA